MPTVLRLNGFRFFFYSYEPNESPHVHIDCDEATIPVWLDSGVVTESRRFRAHEIGGIPLVVTKHRAML